MDKIIQALKILVALRHIHPIFSVDEASCKVAHTARFNQVIMDRARHDNNMKYLASPLLAGGIAVNRFHLLFLLAKHHGMQAPEQWAQFAWESISAIEPRIRIQGRVLEDPKECKAEFERRALQFSRRELPLFEKLGIA